MANKRASNITPSNDKQKLVLPYQIKHKRDLSQPKGEEAANLKSEATLEASTLQ